MGIKKALVSGITGQDGSWLADFLLAKGYKVYGTIRRHSTKESETTRINHLLGNIEVDYCDITDAASVGNLIMKVKPHEVYHLAAMSDVRISFDQPNYTFDTIVSGTLNVLEAVKLLSENTRVYNAATSEIFGNSSNRRGFQDESTPRNPVSPYGIAKNAAFELVRCYRNSYNMFASNGILYNHEGSRRGENFVTAKIVKSLCEIFKEKRDKFSLGNINASRDWGDARDYVRAMYMILQHDEPGDFICATGKTRTVEDFVYTVMKELKLKGRLDDYVDYDTNLLRPNELKCLRGNAKKAKKELGWEPTISFEQMVKDMINYWLGKV